VYAVFDSYNVPNSPPIVLLPASRSIHRRPSLPSFPVKMFWGRPRPVKSSESTPTSQNQVTHTHHYGPSGALEFVLRVIT